LTAALVVAISGAMTIGNQACAQKNASNAPTPTLVVLLDLDKLQRENPRLKLGMEQLNEQAQAMDLELKKESEAIKEMTAKLKQYRAGTPEYDDMDTRIVKKIADFRAQEAMRQKELTKKQWKLAYSVFKDIQEEVEAFAARNQIAAVIRFNSDQPDIENPQAIQLDLMTKNVVWYEASLDITVDIKKALDRRYEKLGSRQGFPAPQSERR
jgi:Skp family chaperone for outer membrane proteins